MPREDSPPGQSAFGAATAPASTPTSLAHRRAKLIAFYLPQFHPIPENDQWWGAGFTEWTNVRKARPLYRGHYQPRTPGVLGYYDLLENSDVRFAQAELAAAHGISAFCYWHYWFGDGKRLLEKPLERVLASGQPHFPFCLAWANQTWTGIWHGAHDRILIEQTYPGRADYEAHFYAILPAFADGRYFKVGGRNLFSIYRPFSLPDTKAFTDQWQELAHKNGLPPFYFVGVHYWPVPEIASYGLDALAFSREHFLKNIKLKFSLDLLLNVLRGRPLRTVSYAKMMQHFLVDEPLPYPGYPTLIHDWDNTPRAGKRGVIMKGASPTLFRQHAQQALDLLDKYPFEHRLVFVKSWNEWAEGNHLEPDQKHGTGYLEVLRDLVQPSVTTSTNRE